MVRSHISIVSCVLSRYVTLPICHYIISLNIKLYINFYHIMNAKNTHYEGDCETIFRNQC